MRTEAAAQREGQRLAQRLGPLDEDDVGARHHDLADDRVAQLEDRVDHHPLAVLDELVLLREVDQLAQLGLGGERSLAEALAGREGVADQDQQLRQRTEHPGQRVHEPGAGERDRRRVLTAESSRRDADRDVGHQHHRGGRREHCLPLVVEEVERRDRHQHWWRPARP
jgi:hypothetical protein